MGATLLRWALMLGRSPRAQLPDWSAAAVATVAVTIATIIASMFYLDAAAIDWARQLPRWLIDEADEVTNLGLSGYFLYPLGFMLLALAAIWTPSLPPIPQGVVGSLAARVGFLFVAIAAPSLFATILKRLIGRARPYVGNTDDPFAYIPFIWRAEYASMPSGHATTAAAAAIAIGAVWPSLRAVVWIYALIILATRVIIAVHHPSDVIAGALVGVVGALMIRRWFAAQRLVFRPTDLRPYATPSWRRLRIVGCQVMCRQISSRD